MSKFQKKPVVVEAITFDELVAHGIASGGNVVNGLPWSFSYGGYPITHGLTQENGDCYLIPTLEGTMRMGRGDMLITGVHSEIYPCKRDIFEATYSPARQEVVICDVDVLTVPTLSSLGSHLGSITSGEVNAPESAGPQPPVDSVSEGLRLVPIEPTNGMVDAGLDAVCSGDAPEDDAVNMYRAMVAAAPTAAPMALGIERAARHVEKLREDFDAEHGHTDPETGAFEYGTGPRAQAAEEYSNALYDIVERIRAIEGASTIEQDLAALIARANAEGQVVCIDLHPTEPLAMGRYEMRGHIRPARGEVGAGKPATPAPEGMTFGEAIEALKLGQRVARAGWNGKSMWLSLVRAGRYDIYDHYAKPPFSGRPAEEVFLPWIAMKTADSKFVPWLASQTDMLCEDWSVVP